MNYLLDENGDKLTLFHGTNRKFTKHNPEKNRTILNDNYQGDWICYTPEESVGWKYAKAARNQYFDKQDFLEETKSVFSKISEESVEFMLDFSKIMMESNSDNCWDNAIENWANKNNVDIDNAPYEFFQKVRGYEEALNFNINDFSDCLESVEYSKMGTSDSLNDIIDFFSGGSSQGIAEHDIEMLKEMGYENIIPEERILEAHVKANNVLKTKSRTAAKNAIDNGYDLVIYSGVDCVDDVPEYLIKDPSQLEMKAVVRKIKHEEYENEDDYSTTTVYRFEREEIKDKEPELKNNKRSKNRLK